MHSIFSAQPVTSLLADKNHTKWLDLMKKAGFDEEADNAINRTMFVPSEEAIEKDKLEELDIESLKDVISLHISEKPICSCQMKNNLMIPSLKPENELRVTTYESVSIYFNNHSGKRMLATRMERLTILNLFTEWSSIRWLGPENNGTMRHYRRKRRKSL